MRLLAITVEGGAATGFQGQGLIGGTKLNRNIFQQQPKGISGNKFNLVLLFRNPPDYISCPITNAYPWHRSESTRQWALSGSRRCSNSSACPS